VLLLDVNVLLAAHRDDHPHFPVVRPWLDRTLDDAAETPGLSPMVAGSFVRLATHRRVFPVPTPRDDAFGFLDALAAQPTCLLVPPGSRHLVLLRHVCEEADAMGDLVPDAVLAAVAVEQAAEIVTLDRVFARFPSVRHRLLQER
jgi:toxin-antitoxin system PIN domain toxin